MNGAYNSVKIDLILVRDLVWQRFCGEQRLKFWHLRARTLGPMAKKSQKEHIHCKLGDGFHIHSIRVPKKPEWNEWNVPLLLFKLMFGLTFLLFHFEVSH